jgi:hypothetical protein
MTRIEQRIRLVSAKTQRAGTSCWGEPILLVIHHTAAGILAMMICIFILRMIDDLYRIDQDESNEYADAAAGVVGSLVILTGHFCSELSFDTTRRSRPLFSVIER